MRESGMVTSRKDIPPLSLLSKVSYGLGDFASGLSWTFIGSYFAVFLTDGVGISAGAVSLLLLLTKFWDGINDPIVGAIEERTKSKWGRFRPWILWGCPFLALANVICFTAPFQGMTAKIIWAVFGYLLIDTFYGMVNLGYGALSTVMTYDPKERTELNSYRMIGLLVGNIILGALAMPLILVFSGGDKPMTTGYTFAALLFSALSIPLFLLLFFTSREVVKPISEEKVSIMKSIKVTVTNKPLVCVFFICLFANTSFSGRMGTVVFYFINNLGRYDLIGPLMMVLSTASVITMFALKGIIDRFGKVRMLIISFVSTAIVYTAIFLIDPVANTAALFVLTALAGFTNGISFPLYYALVPEAIDYMEDKTGVRTDGVSYTSISLSLKIATAVGTSLGLAIMGAFGYISGAEKQSDETHIGINIAVNLVPAALLLLGLIPAFLYPLNNKKNKEIRARLEAKALEKEAAILI
jgi:GPH family glycoside/pentoside/hexuronide:cation symporter/probable glucitol transport protein GutA